MVRRFFLALVVCVVTACGDDIIGPEDVAGTYTLQSIDGEALPAVPSLPTYVRHSAPKELE